MNLINFTVIHKTFGKGKIVDFNILHITVDFAGEIRKLLLAYTMNNGLMSFEDNAAQSYVMMLLKQEDEKKAAAEKERLEREKLADEKRAKINEEQKKAFLEAEQLCHWAIEEQNNNCVEYVCRHESSHALILQLLRPGCVIEIVMGTGIDGHVLYKIYNKELDPLEEVIVNLAGHAAELLYNPKLTFRRSPRRCLILGCVRDYRNVRSSLEAFYRQNGTIKALNKYPGDRGIVTVDRQIGRDIKFFLSYVQEILKENETLMLAVSSALAEKQTLRRDDFLNICNRYGLGTDNYKKLKQYMSLYRRQPVYFESKRDC